MNRRFPRGVLGAALPIALAIGVVASLFLGSQSLSGPQVWDSLTGHGREADDAVVIGLRVPRTVLAVILGAALGLAGALAQEHTRNPLADPGLLGVTAGAAGGVVAAVMLFGLTRATDYVWFALGGALLVAALVLGLAARMVTFSPATTVVVTGAVMTALLTSLSSAAILMDRTVAGVFRFWTVGTIAGRDLDVVWAIAPVLLVGLVLAALNLPALDPLALGDVHAASLGRNVRLDRLIGLAAVACLSAGATAACGSVAFLGLLAPHAGRALVGQHRAAAAIVSAGVAVVLVLAADVTGRVMLAEGEVPVGIVLALAGAPGFVVLARRQERA